MITIEGVSKTYRASERKALDDVSLHVPAGCVFGLLGPNGAGKTTLLSILVGLVAADSGRVEVDGLELSHDPAAIRARIGFVPQTLAFYPMLTVRENLAFFAGAGGLPRDQRAARIELAVSVAALEPHLGTPAERLSGGLQRRLNLAIGLLNRPRLLCLDEPTVGIDPQSRAFILDSISQLNAEGVTVVYTSHYMDEVEQICERIAIIDQGRILLVGSLGELLGRRSEEARLSCGFAEPPSAELAQELERRFAAGFPTPHEMVLHTDNPLSVLEALALLLRERGGSAVTSVHYGHRNLEELFLALTHRALRDDP